MAELSYSCNVAQGFQFQKDVQSDVGYLNSLSISGEDLEQDLTVQDPEDIEGEGKLEVAGVIESIYWAGGYTDPIQINCNVSNTNKVLLQTLTHKTLSNTDVTMEFTIYDYDPDEKIYYKCMHTDGQELSGLVEKSGGELAISIDTEQNMEVVSPKNHSMNIGVMPGETAQEIHVAISVSANFVKQYGMKVG